MKHFKITIMCFSLIFFAIFLVWQKKHATSHMVKNLTNEQRSENYQLIGNRKVKNYNEAKKYLPGIHKGFEETLYCGCSYRNNLINHQNCYFKPPDYSKRSFRLEWEHVVPAYSIGRYLPAWKNGHSRCINKNGKPFRGRRCARKTSRKFNYFEGDLYNLLPAIGEINALRGALPMGEISQNLKKHSPCQEILQQNRVHPREEIKGLIARIYKYMNHSYPGFKIINKKNKKMFDQWDREHPPQAEEIKRASRIYKIQGNKNFFIKRN